MKLELSPDITDDGSDAIHQSADHAGFTKDGLYSWVYKDSVLEIIYAKTNEIFADWRFGKALKDKNAIISCVTDFDCSEGRMLLVATESVSDEGTLCLFSFSKKRVIRAVEFPRKIKAVEIVFTNTNEDVPSWILSKHLHFFCGLAAVGTEGGFTYLVDLRLDDVMLNSTTEISFKKLTVYGAGLIEPKAKRDAVCSNDKHMAVLLDNMCHRNEQFYYRRQDDSIEKAFDEDAVCITSLKYLSQAGILAIGFNFGCFQLWRLHTPVLDYSSRFTEDTNPVSNFVVQEPENDPRNLVYLWVGRDRSIIGEEDGHGQLSTISLYQLCFNKKDTYARFGLFYEDLESVCGRLDHNLQLNPYLGGYNQTTWSSQIICAYTIVNPVYAPPAAVANDSFEEGSHGNDLSLSVFVWRADSKQSGHSPCYWMAIFDLNRWYHAQMPHRVRCIGSLQQVCPYWAVYKLDDLVTLSYPQSLLHVQLTGNNVLKFSCKSFLPPEEHSYPSALEITDVRFITPERMIKGHCYGWQGRLLQELVRDGAMHLVSPDNFYHQCLQARLIPQSYSDNNTVEYQRKALLNLSLDYNLTVCLVHKCVEAWMDGEFVDAGCSLSLLLDWAWQALARTKEKLDTTCQILYDCSGRILDPYTDWLIRHQFCSLSSLKQVFTIFLLQPNAITIKGHQELELRLEVLRLLVEHHNLVQWCLIEGLLPEIKEGSTQLPGLFPYPYSDLCRATHKRRVEFKALKGLATNHSLLLIDGLVKCAGPQIASIWEVEGKDELYPPTSMQALMNLFLLEDILLEVKQAIMLYFLQDLAAVLGCDDEDRQNVVVSFVRSFGILPSLVHTIHGLWCIDHRDYEEGLRQLVNPNVQPHVWSSWMDVSIINTLLAQGQEATAARYMCSGHGLGATLEEQRLNIAVLVRNRKVSAAVDYMRQRCYHKKDPSDLMPFMLKECQNNKMIGQLLQLHLLQVEEMEVEKYLRDRSEPQALEPLLLYYLTHSRFVEAYMLNEEMNKLDKLEATCPAAREKAANRNRLMEAYLRVLPDITRKVLMEKQHRPNVMVAKRVEVVKPKPLSTMVYKKEPHILSRSHLIMAVMDKVEEAMNAVEDCEQVAEELVNPVDTEDKHRSVYMATPLTPRYKSYVSLAQTPEERITYPEEAPSSALPTNPLSAAKKKLDERWGTGENLEEYRSLSALTKECLDLLKTPVKVPSSEISPRANLTAAMVKTPQSILKVRRLSKTLLRSESRKTPDSGKRPKRLGFSASTDTVVTSPSSSPQDTKSIPAATPKQLRFVGLSPSPSPSPLPVHSKQLSLSAAETSQSFVSEEESQEITDSGKEEKMEVERVEGLVEDKTEAVENAVDVTGVNTMGESDTLAGEVVPADRAECMETSQSEEEKEVVSVPVGVTKQTVIETLNITEEVVVKSFDEGPHDRYDDELDRLVRPDLQSPWKHNTSSEEVVTVDENNFTLHLTHIEGEGMTPAMTSSPLEESPQKQDDNKIDMAVPVKSVIEVAENDFGKNGVHADVKEDDDATIKELKRNFLLSLVAPRPPEAESSLTSIGLSHHMRLSYVSSLNVETNTTLTDKSRFESSPQKTIEEPDSPPATPPLSKRAKMITRGTRKSTFNLVTPRRELRSTRSSERQLKTSVSRKTISMETTEVEKIGEEDTVSKSTAEKSPERKSPARSLKRKAVNEETEHDKDADKETLPLTTRSRRTPVRRSPSRSVRKTTDEADELVSDEDNIKGDDESAKATDDVLSQSRIRQTSVRRSPARSSKKIAVQIETDQDDVVEEQDVSMRTRLRSKTPERKSPGRSTRKKVEETHELETVEESNNTMEELEKVTSDLPLQSSTQASDETCEAEVKNSCAADIVNVRQPKTPERKSPSRSVRASKTDIDASQKGTDLGEETSTETGVSTRLRSSPARTTRSSKTPERKAPTRTSKVMEKQTIEVVTEETMPLESENEPKDEDFIPGEEFVSKLNEEMEMAPPSSPTRRRSLRLNTPERGVNSSHTLESSRRLSGGRSTSVRSTAADSNEPALALEQKTVHVTRSTTTPDREEEDLSLSLRRSGGRSTSVRSTAADSNEPALALEQKTVHVTRSTTTPDREEEDLSLSLRRSRRQSRTPERFRAEKEETISTPPKDRKPSPARKSTLQRGKGSPGRSSAPTEIEEMPSIQEHPKSKRNLTDALVEEASDAVKKDLEDVVQESAWNEELPPLRLETEADANHNDEGAKPDILFKQLFTPSQSLRPSQPSESVFSSPFVFSDPVTHTDDHASVKGPEKEDEPVHDFVFSHPTVFEDDIVDTKEETPKVEKSVKKVTGTRAKSQRQRRRLMDSPDLLPVSADLSQLNQTKKERSRSRMSDIQKASASVVRRYSFRRSGPVTRRLVPSSKHSDEHKN